MKKLLTTHIIPFRRNNRYYNHEHDQPENLIFQTLPSFIGSLKNRSKRRPLNPEQWVVPLAIQPYEQKPTITWLGHAGFLIQINNVNIVTDPIFGHLSWFFPHMLESAFFVQELPTIDLVLLSHNHPDHAHMRSIKQLTFAPHNTFAVAQGDKQWINSHKFENVHEFSWWEQMDIATEKGSVTITFLPAHHWSARGLFDRNKSLWGSWMIQANGYTIYFGGDTAYWGHFQAIAKEFSIINMALLPVGPCEPSAWMQRTHMSPEQAINAAHDLKSEHFIPMHWGSFAFGADHFDTPLQRLQTAWSVQPHSLMKLVIVKVGQTFAV